MPSEIIYIGLKLKKELNAIVLGSESNIKKPAVIDFELNKDELPLSLNLARSADIEKIKMRYFPGIKKWCINSTYEEVVEFGCCFMDSALIRESRVYYATGCYENGIYVKKSEEFIKWAEKLFRLLKKELIKIEDNGYILYVGKQTHAWLLNSNKNFKFQGELIIY